MSDSDITRPLAKDSPLPEHLALSALISDPEACNALRELDNQGLSAAEAIACLTSIMGQWAAFERERPGHKRDRRRALANRVRDLARKLREDPEARNDILVDHSTVLQGGDLERKAYPGAPTVAGFLGQYADIIAGGDNALDRYDETNMAVRITKNNTRAHFVKRQVKLLVTQVMTGAEAERVAATLASALLGEKVTKKSIQDIDI